MTIDVINFGCRLNVYEGEALKAKAAESGLKNTIIINSCAVTSEAERQVRQSIRRARKQHPDAKIIVTGCSAQIHPDMYAKMDEVNHVIGNQEKLDQEVYRSLRSPLEGEQLRANASDARSVGGKSTNIIPHDSLHSSTPPQGGGIFGRDDEKILVNDIMSVKETASHLVTSFEGHTRAFVQVQNGCNHRCTFCIIPFGRGNSRSVPMGDIVTQVRTLVESGYKEIVLTGVDISDYGKDLPGAPTLGQMMKRLLKLIPELPRLRLSSIDAVEVDDDLYYLLANEPRLMPHLHISLQAGDDMVLKRMKRRHLRPDIVEFCQRVRNLRPDIVFGADIIAGFPTETDEMFANTLALVEEVGLTYLHVFPYSSRPGTPAARMPQVSKAIRKYRAEQLRLAGKKQEEKFYQSLVGQTLQVLVEQNNTGRTEHFAPVRLNDAIAGSISPVIIGNYDQHALSGTVIPAEAGIQYATENTPTEHMYL